jgi:hypothetical protein
MKYLVALVVYLLVAGLTGVLWYALMRGGTPFRDEE